MARARATSTTREIIAGCRRCFGNNVQWRGAHAQGMAAQHHDRTKHETWATVTMHVTYGVAKPAGAKEPKLL